MRALFRKGSAPKDCVPSFRLVCAETPKNSLMLRSSFCLSLCFALSLQIAAAEQLPTSPASTTTPGTAYEPFALKTPAGSGETTAGPPTGDPSVLGNLKIDKTTAPPQIDGVMGDGEWKGATKTELTFQVYPGADDNPASEHTEAFILYDREHLYVAFHAFDSNPSAIRAAMSKRDSIDADDYVTIFLDTYDDKQRAYYLSVSAQGIQQDGIYTESAGSDPKWDGIFESKATRTSDGYIVEIAVPFKTIRFQAGKDARWGLLLRRWIPRKQERVSWTRVSRDQSSLLAQAGTLTGLDDVFSGRTMDIIPTLTGSYTATREVDPTSPTGAHLHGVNKLDPGLTIIYSVAPNATISATINPDFSQVEADVPQISVNQRFPLSFPEKRPFFLEGSEFFNTTASGGFRLLDTRQIVDPDWGVKFSGKFGRNTLSYLAASDRSAGLRAATTDPAFGKKALFNMFRYQRDVMKDSALGIFITDRRFAGSSNTLVAGEGNIRPDNANTIGLQFIWTKTKTLTGQNLQGYAHNIRLTHYSRHWHIYLHDEYVQPNYRSQAGFIRRTNYHESAADVGYEWRPKEKSSLSKWLVYVWPYFIVNRSYTLDHQPEVNYKDPAVEFVFKRGVQVNWYHTFHHDGFAGKTFDYNFGYLSWSVDSFKRVSFSGSITRGDGINFDPANAVLGNSFTTRQTITLRPTSRVNSEFLYLKSELRNQTTGARFFNQDIIRNRTIYQLTQSQAIRSIVEYETSQRQLGLSFLYSYTPRPNTAVYVGYNDLLFNGLDPLNRTRVPGVFRQQRTLFAKMSYNVRF